MPGLQFVGWQALGSQFLGSQFLTLTAGWQFALLVAALVNLNKGNGSTVVFAARSGAGVVATATVVALAWQAVVVAAIFLAWHCAGEQLVFAAVV